MRLQSVEGLERVDIRETMSDIETRKTETEVKNINR